MKIDKDHPVFIRTGLGSFKYLDKRETSNSIILQILTNIGHSVLSVFIKKLNSIGKGIKALTEKSDKNINIKEKKSLEIQINTLNKELLHLLIKIQRSMRHALKFFLNTLRCI